MPAPILGVAGTESLTPAEFFVGCRKHAHWFVPYVLGVENGRLQNEMQWFWDSEPGGDSYMELPRGHTKTSSVAGRIAWEIGNDHDIRIKLLSSNDDEAAKTVTMAKRIVESPEFRDVFPEVERDKDNWGNTAFTVRRRRYRRDPTLEGLSILGRPGGRTDLLIPDDVCDLRNAVMQPMVRETVKEFFRSVWLPTRDWSAKRRPRTWRIGTPYHVADITADWRKRHKANGSLFRRPVIDFKSPWPEAYSVEQMRELREELGPIAFARAYELVPVSQDQLIFPSPWLDRSLYFGEVPDHERLTGTCIAAIDFAFGDKKMGGGKANPDWSVLLIGRKAMDGTLWLERLFRVQASFPEFTRLCAREMAYAGVQTAFAEGQGPQAGLVQQVQQECRVPVVPVLRAKDKITRATEIQPFVERGMLRIRADRETREPTQEMRPLYDEMATFPAGDKDDCCDCAIALVNGCGAVSSNNDAVPTMVRSERPRLWRLRYAG